MTVRVYVSSGIDNALNNLCCAKAVLEEAVTVAVRGAERFAEPPLNVSCKMIVNERNPQVFNRRTLASPKPGPVLPNHSMPVPVNVKENDAEVSLVMCKVLFTAVGSKT